ncbi:MAG: translation initiation factor IF-2 [Novosphingobium sp.]|nr:translation initiation factor IF-2 [Novosphingobium sp.]
MAIRVYELSKKLELSNKELLDILNSLGVEVTSHISVLPEDIIELIEEEVKNKISKSKDSVSEASLGKVISNPNTVTKSVEHINNHKNKAKNKLENITDTDDGKNQDLSLSLKALSVIDISEKLNKPANEIILTLLKQGIVVTKNQILPEKTIKKIADIYGLKITNEEEIKNTESNILNNIPSPLESTEKGNLVEKIPIVVVIGHVDHGKTTLLDFIRDTKVAAKEKGGITQHLGAYEVNIDQGNMVFLDTPGHEAFSTLRIRGLKAADIAILIVAADDGVKPQTIEAINHAKSVGLPIIVAINKIDKASAKQIDIVEQQLSKYNLIKEEWGGNTPIVHISAKEGTGVDQLLEIIALQSQLMELKANISVPARGYILESKSEKGRGPVATVISQNGILKIGDYFFAGNTYGKVNALVNSFGKRIKQAEPSIPVLVSGFNEMPHAGDIFRVVSAQEYKKKPENKFRKSELESKPKNVYSESGINIIVKSDNASSQEALLKSIMKLSSSLDQKFNIVYSGLSDITESDVILALDTKSMIYAFHVKALPNALNIIAKNNITVKYFDIIYNLLEDLEAVSESLKPIKYISKKIGQGSVIKVFNIKSLGKVAGVYVKSGKFIKDGKIVIIRDNQKIGEGQIKSLEREKRSVKEVNTGYEFALLTDDFQDWQLEDIIECYQEIPA